MKDIGELTELLRVLQDPTRLRLLRGLGYGELSVGEIVQVTGLSQPRVSRHLRLLCEARVVRRTPDQNEVYYRTHVDDDRRRVASAVLASLPEDDPVIVRDKQRLTAILDRRQARAEALLARLGVQVLSARETADVRAVVDRLLDRRVLPSRDREPLREVLDIGTGTGSMLPVLAARARRAIALDLSRDMRLIARATVLSAGLANCTVRQGDMYDLEFPDGRFDMVAMDRVLGTADDPEKALGEAARVLNDRGHLLVIETAGALARGGRLKRYLEKSDLVPVRQEAAARERALVALAARNSGHESGSP